MTELLPHFKFTWGNEEDEVDIGIEGTHQIYGTFLSGGYGGRKLINLTQKYADSCKN